MAKFTEAMQADLYFARKRRRAQTEQRIRMPGDSIRDDAEAGDLVGVLAVTRGTGDYTFTLDDDADGKFELDTDTSRLLVAEELDFDVAKYHAITVTADNGEDDPITADLAIRVIAEPRIRLAGDDIDEDAQVDDLVGMLSVTHGAGTYTFTLDDDAGGKFALDPEDTSRLLVAGALDFDADPSHVISVTADNGVDAPIARDFTITVNDVA